VIPHISKRLFGADYRLLFCACALLGPILMIYADVISKLINFPYETPVGVICALIGAPYFLYQTLHLRELEQ
jgi:iron complex transport system permease protein